MDLDLTPQPHLWYGIHMDTTTFTPTAILSREWTGRPTLSFVSRTLGGKMVAVGDTLDECLSLTEARGYRPSGERIACADENLAYC